MHRQPARVIVYAWGRAYVDRLLKNAVASLLAPGNLPALVEFFDCTLVVVTEEKLFNYIASHPLIERVKSLCPVRLISLDDVIGEPWQYGISLAYALFRGFADLGPAMTKTYLLFLNADYVLADGCYERLIPYMERGERVILSPSYCTVEEEVEPILERIREAQDGILRISPRQLARMIIDHRHNTIRAKTISQQSVHFEYMDQVYWQVDDDTIIGHQMPICMVVMRPETALGDLNTFWDWGVVYEFCPSQRLTVLGDSDEFLILELRSENTHLDLVRLGPATPNAAAARMSVYLTRYQLDNARFPLTLHASSLPSDIDRPRSELQAFLDAVLMDYRNNQPPHHRNHPQWLYHKAHLSQHLELRRLRQQLDRLGRGYDAEGARLLRLRDSAKRLLEAGFVLPNLDEQVELDLGFLAEAATREAIPEGGDPDATADLALPEHQIGVEGRFARALQELFDRYRAAAAALEARLARLEETPLPTLDDFFEHVHSGDRGPRSPKLRQPDSVLRSGRQTAARLCGSVPHTRAWHPLHFIYKDIGAALDRADEAGSGVLFVGDKKGLAARAGARPRNLCLRISTAGLLRSEIEPTVDQPWCGLSVIELALDDFPHIRRLHHAVLPHMRLGARIVMFWINHGCESGEAVRRAVVHGALMQDEGADVRFICSPAGWGGLELVKAIGKEMPGSRAARGFLFLATLMRLSLRALSRGGATVERGISGNCLGMIIDIDVAHPLDAAPAEPLPIETDEALWDGVAPAGLAAE